jgi:hypothetical protein
LEYKKGKIMTEDTKVTVTLGFTKNLGNFESLRVDIGIQDYVRKGETVNEATDRVYKFVEDKLTEKSTEIAEELSGNKK